MGTTEFIVAERESGWKRNGIRMERGATRAVDQQQYQAPRPHNRLQYAIRPYGAALGAAVTPAVDGAATVRPQLLHETGETVAIYKLGDAAPTIHESVFVADTATIIGKVSLEENASVWFGAAIRGDNELISVGQGSNVQEGAVLHTDPGYPLTIEANVTIGHQAMLHGCTIKEGALVGIQAVVLNGAVIGRNCLVGAGAVVTEDKVFPDNSLILGAPAKVVRELTEADITRMHRNTANYVERRAFFKAQLVRIG
jgi:carbonic anhydrase/acetyltransferase-like protein (isoleucine patch superfamily)